MALMASKDGLVAGSVKWYNADKDYGFLLPSDAGAGDVYFSPSHLKLPRAPISGEKVYYSVKVDKNGKTVASEVRFVNVSPGPPAPALGAPTVQVHLFAPPAPQAYAPFPFPPYAFPPATAYGAPPVQATPTPVFDYSAYQPGADPNADAYAAYFAHVAAAGQPGASPAFPQQGEQAMNSYLQPGATYPPPGRAQSAYQAYTQPGSPAAAAYQGQTAAALTYKSPPVSFHLPVGAPSYGYAPPTGAWSMPGGQESGTIKFYEEKKKFGFILPSAGGADLHFTEQHVVGGGSTLSKGCQVTYTRRMSAEGKMWGDNIRVSSGQKRKLG
eukprot:gb/GEZN01007827.1/.p1 GENE.gb/GEZN01007827.1/~~gb/GEZN01007827.1/.p1  ORF type:complete len:372 (-),score=50.43 gb/GEZN01007827.1/:380-1360(-)